MCEGADAESVVVMVPVDIGACDSPFDGRCSDARLDDEDGGGGADVVAAVGGISDGDGDGIVCIVSMDDRRVGFDEVAFGGRLAFVTR